VAVFPGANELRHDTAGIVPVSGPKFPEPRGDVGAQTVNML
jgi:hypothetical protein